MEDSELESVGKNVPCNDLETVASTKKKLFWLKNGK